MKAHLAVEWPGLALFGDFEQVIFASRHFRQVRPNLVRGEHVEALFTATKKNKVEILIFQPNVGLPTKIY